MHWALPCLFRLPPLPGTLAKPCLESAGLFSELRLLPSQGGLEEDGLVWPGREGPSLDAWQPLGTQLVLFLMVPIAREWTGTDVKRCSVPVINLPSVGWVGE